MEKSISALLGIGVIASGVLLFSARGSSAREVIAPPPSVPGSSALKSDTAIFAGGCFWGIDAVFRRVRGVTSVSSGYTGGASAAPSYEQVSSGTTGHAEAVEIVFDPSVVSYSQLLQVFFSVHDPTQLNRQGPDHGTQYRSAVFYTSDAQKKAVEAYIAQMTREKTFKDPIVTQVAPLVRYWIAEEYHQNYFAKHPNQPYIVIHDAPKVELLRKRFSSLYREPIDN